MSARTVTGGNRHRVPDSAINGYISIDYTLEEMKTATEERESWTTAAVNERRARLARAPVAPNPTTNVKNLQGGTDKGASLSSLLGCQANIYFSSGRAAIDPGNKVYAVSKAACHGS